MKLSHARGATQDGRVMVERSDRMWSAGEGNGKPLQYSCLENPMNSMKRQNDRILKEKLPRSIGAQYATGELRELVMDRDAWRAAIHGVAKNRTWLSDWTELNWTFPVPMQYCSLEHQTLLLSPVISTAGCCFYFGSFSSFFLELFLHWSPAAYWAPTDLGSSSFSILSFCLFILFMGFSRQEYWSGLTFPSPVDHILSDLSSMTHPFWVAPHGMA